MPYMTRNPRATFAFPKHSVGVTAAAVAVLLVALAVPVWTGHGADNRAPDLGSCQNLRAGSGEKVALRVFAEGVQIYRWNGTSWVFDAPEALLFADAGGHGVVGTHYRGPTWETNSGGKVVAAVLDRCTPDPSAIPWFALEPVSYEGPGIFHDVSFIQRVNTVGGIAPTDPGVAGEVRRVPYTADYFFYREQH